MDLGLTDKVAIVTGSSRGLGLASAGRSWPKAAACASARAARSGWPRPRSKSRRRAQAPESWSRRCRPTCPRRTASSVVIETAVETFGGLDVLVNNVGRAGGADLLDTSDAEWQAAFDETLFPAIRASRLAVPHMRQRGGGAIVMIASIYGREAGGRMTYNAVKAAEISLAKSLAQQLAPLNIRVNSVAPGRSSSPAAPGTGASRPIPKASPSSSAASCRSAASGVPTKSAPPSRSSPRRAPAGSAARAFRSTACQGRSNI